MWNHHWLLLSISLAKHSVATDRSSSPDEVANHQRHAPVRRENPSPASIASNATTSSPDSDGLSSAESCARELIDWQSSSSSWSFAHNVTVVNIETYTQPLWSTQTLPIFEATSTTKLCDGFPRVVGHARSTTVTTVLGTSGAFTNSLYEVTQFKYNVPPYSASTGPCTIRPQDCQSLYDKNASLVQYRGASICSFSPTPITTKTYPTDPDGTVCSICYLRAENASMLYWPVRTVEGSGSLCNKTDQTVGLTRTADGPNTFVTEGVTITSPSVGIALVGLSRQDGCFMTVPSTIVVVHASEVSTVRGARALYDHRPFDFQDLNYKCQSPNSSTSWIQDRPGDDCYQEVPAEAYFSGESAFNWDEYYPTALGPKLTIGPNYRPYVLLPASMTAWANSVYNDSGCQIQVDGVWDPPYALLQATAVGKNLPAWQTATTTSATNATMPVSSSPRALDPGSTLPNPTPTWRTASSSSRYTAEYQTRSADVTPTTASATTSVTRSGISEPKTTLATIMQGRQEFTLVEDGDSLYVAATGSTAAVPPSGSVLTFGSAVLTIPSSVLKPSMLSGSTSNGGNSSDAAASRSITASTARTASVLPTSTTSSLVSTVSFSDGSALRVPSLVGLLFTFFFSAF